FSLRSFIIAGSGGRKYLNHQIRRAFDGLIADDGLSRVGNENYIRLINVHVAEEYIEWPNDNFAEGTLRQKLAQEAEDLSGDGLMICFWGWRHDEFAPDDLEIRRPI